MKCPEHPERRGGSLLPERLQDTCGLYGDPTAPSPLTPPARGPGNRTTAERQVSALGDVCSRSGFGLTVAYGDPKSPSPLTPPAFDPGTAGTGRAQARLTAPLPLADTQTRLILLDPRPDRHNLGDLKLRPLGASKRAWRLFSSRCLRMILPVSLDFRGSKNPPRPLPPDPTPHTLIYRPACAPLALPLIRRRRHRLQAPSRSRMRGILKPTPRSLSSRLCSRSATMRRQ